MPGIESFSRKKPNPEPKMNVTEGLDMLSGYLVEHSLRFTRELIQHPLVILNEDLSESTWPLIALEFLIVDTHFLEREFARVGLSRHFDTFIQPLRQLALLRFIGAVLPDCTDSESHMRRWDSALEIYYSMEDFWRQPLEPESKQSVSGQFGTRVAAVCGEDAFSTIAIGASVTLGNEIIGYRKSGFLEKAFETIIWPS